MEANGVKASFFVIGQNIDAESSSMMIRAHKMGCDIENHTFTHTALNSETPEQMLDEMFQTIPMPAICGQGCDDWLPEVSAEERARRVIEAAEDGQIILLHDFEGNDNTVEALKTIIPELKKQGFRFVTVPELFARRNVEPLNGKMYTNVKD